MLPNKAGAAQALAVNLEPDTSSKSGVIRGAMHRACTQEEVNPNCAGRQGGFTSDASAQPGAPARRPRAQPCLYTV